MRQGGILGLIAFAIVGVIVADVLIHPAGVKAAGNVANRGLANTYGALLGKAP